MKRRRARRRMSWRSAGTGWSRTTLLHVRMLVGERIAKEPVFVALAQEASEETAHWMRIKAPFLGVEMAVVGSRVLWRRVARIARTAEALRDSFAAWKNPLEGVRTWLSVPEGRVSRDPGRLEAVLVRALVLEVVGRRCSGRTGGP